MRWNMNLFILFFATACEGCEEKEVDSAEIVEDSSTEDTAE